MVKKIIAIMLCAFTLCSVGIPAMAATWDYKSTVIAAPTLTAGVNGIEKLTNGKLETVSADGKQFSDWSFMTAATGQSFIGSTVFSLEDTTVNSSAIVNGGNRAVRFTATDVNTNGYDAAIRQNISLQGTEEGLTCEMTASVYPVTNNADAYLRADIYNAAGTRLTILSLPFKGEGQGQWTRKTLQFKLGAEATSIVFYAMVNGPGTAIFDDISFMAEGEPVKPPHDWQDKVISAPTLTAGVNGAEMIKNGGLETTVENGKKFYKWGFLTSAVVGEENQGFLGSTIATLEDKNVNSNAIVHSGNRALKFTVTDTNPEGYDAAILQGFNLTGTEDGVLCEVTASVYPVTENADAYIRIDVNGENNNRIKILYLSFKGCPQGQWSKKTLQFVLDTEAQNFSFYAMVNGPGSAIFDDISFVADVEPSETESPMPEEKTPLSINLLRNGDFEKYESMGSSSNWRNTRNASYSTEYKRSGTYSLKLEPKYTEGIGYDSLAQQTVYYDMATEAAARRETARGEGLILESGAAYQAIAYVLTPTDNEMNFSFEMFWYSTKSPDAEKQMQYSTKGHRMYTQSDEWQKFVFEFTAPEIPEGEEGLSAYFRLRCMSEMGTVYVDDAALYKVAEADVLFNTDEAIYYTEWDKGNATLQVRESYIARNPDVTGGKAIFRLMDGDSELNRKEITVTGSNVMEYEFSTSLMTANKKGQTYRVEVELFDKKGKSLVKNQKPVYRFDRPTYMCADGVFRKNGQEYYVILGNGVNMARLEREDGPIKGGVNIVQIVADANIPIKEKLDRVLAQGNLAMLSFYNGSICAGSPSRIEATKETVRAVKDHPALWGYKVQDEPTQKGNTEEELLNAYVAIREIDPNHPVYLDDSPYGKYKILARYADIIDIDYYPGDSGNHGTLISNVLSYAYDATRGRKPFTLLQQAFVLSGSTYLHGVNSYRHFAYQTLFEGGSGWGYHSLGSDDGKQEIFMDRPVWDDIIAWKQGGEMDLMLDAFVGGKYPMLNAYKGENVMWRTYLKDGKVYAFVVDRRGTINGGVFEELGTQNVNIPLTDVYGQSRVGAFTATCLYGGTGNTSGNGTLSLQTDDFTATVWEITPQNDTNLTNVYPGLSDNELKTLSTLLAKENADTSKITVAKQDGVNKEYILLVNGSGEEKQYSEAISQAYAEVLIQPLGGEVTLTGGTLSVNLPAGKTMFLCVSEDKSQGFYNGALKYRVPKEGTSAYLNSEQGRIAVLKRVDGTWQLINVYKNLQEFNIADTSESGAYRLVISNVYTLKPQPESPVEWTIE